MKGALKDEMEVLQFQLNRLSLPNTTNKFEKYVTGITSNKVDFLEEPTVHLEILGFQVHQRTPLLAHPRNSH